MEKPFEVGEILIFQKSTMLQQYNGEECLLVGGWETRPCGIRVGGMIEVDDMDCYQVEFEDGFISNCQPYHLRRKRPPSVDDATLTAKEKDNVQTS